MHIGKRTHSSYGFSLLELLVSLSLLGALGTLTAVSISRTVLSAARLTSQTTTQRALIDSFVAITSALDAVESSRLPDRYRIHTGGHLTYPDNSPHPISRLRGTSQPRSGSDALSLLDIDVERTGTLSRVSHSLSGVNLIYCRPIDVLPPKSAYRSLIASSIEGRHQIRISSHNEFSLHDKRCVRFQGNIVKSLFHSSQQDLASIQRISPVRREFTLYVDRTSHLRLVSHLGSQILENQPVTSHLKRLQISKTSARSHTIITVQIEAPSMKPLRWSRVIALPESEDLNDIFS
jgi:prepilin-type N-terminal cleavage/methylation domain-containing protein